MRGGRVGWIETERTLAENTERAARGVRMLRKLAREATIFGLLGMLVAIIGAFLVLDSSARSEARSYAAGTVHGFFPVALDMSKSQPIPPPTPGFTPLVRVISVRIGSRVLNVRVCSDSDKSRDAITEAAEEANNCRYVYDPFKEFGGVMTDIGPKDKAEIAKDYWAAYREHQNVFDNAMASALFGLYGFPAGLAIWIFYRLVRFAVKG